MITNDEEHAAAMKEVERLFNNDFQKGTPEWEHFDKMVNDIVAYEKERWPI